VEEKTTVDGVFRVLIGSWKERAPLLKLIQNHSLYTESSVNNILKIRVV
jgi:hypothetical protein